MCMDEFGAATRSPFVASPAYRGSERDSTDHKVIEDYGLGRKLMRLTPGRCQEEVWQEDPS